ncbi:DNA-binding response regulator, partial [Enterococcus faecalis]
RLSHLHATPEYVRYVVLFLFSDISRQYPTVLEENYVKIVEEIRASNNLNTLYALMQQDLAEVKNKPKIKKYSESV